jgi:RNA polymerase sigma-70 factor (ECF subfamily)
MSEPPSHELLRRVLAERGSALTLYARQWCDSPEDAVQEALVRLAEQPVTPARLAPWLYRVTRNLAISQGRAARRRRRRETRAADGKAWFTSQPQPALDAEAATAALEKLSGEAREVVVARIWGELTFEQIAEVTGLSTTTAHRRYAEGLERLRELLSANETGHMKPSRNASDA